MSQKTRKALSRLLSLIQTGYEFPSAMEHVALAFRLSDIESDALRAAYDRMP